MNKESKLYRKCHDVLKELYESRQIPFLDRDACVQLKHDGAISFNGLYAAITPKGDDMFQTRHYLKLAKEVDYKEKEHELKERDSLTNQITAEQYIEQTKISKKTLSYQKLSLVFSAIAVIGSIVSIINSCQH
jgi:hypothetical protein